MPFPTLYRWIALCLGAFLHCSLLTAQELPFIHYDKELPSSEVFDMIQDTAGIMWICHDKGVTRFDGADFVSVPGPNGAFEKGVTDVEMDLQNRLWFATISGRFYVTKGDSFELAPFQAKLESEKKVILPSLRNFKIDAEGRLLYLGYGCYVQLSPGLPEKVSPSEKSISHIDTTSPDVPVILSYNSPTWATSTLKVGEKAVLSDFELNSSTSNCVFGIDRSVIFLSTNKRLFRIVNGEIVASTTLKSNIDELFGLYKGFLTLCTLQGGLTFLDPITLEVKKQALQGSYCSTIFWDKDDGMWVSTLEHGLFYLPAHFQFTSRILPKRYVIDFAIKDDEITVLAKHGILRFQVDEEQWLFDKETFSKHPNRISYHGDQLIESGVCSRSLDNEGLDTLSPYYSKSHFVSRERLYLASAHGLRYRKWGEEDFQSSDFKTKFLRIYEMAELGEMLYLATGKGLLRWNTQTTSLMPPIASKGYFISIKTKVIGTDTLILAGTHSDGLQIYFGDSMLQLTTKDGLAGNQINDLQFGPNGNFWIGTATGVSKISFANWPKLGQVTNFMETNGLFEHEVHAIDFWEDKVLLGTSKGVELFPVDAAPISYPEKQVRATSILVDGQRLSRKDSVGIQPSNSMVEIRFQAPAYHQLERIAYRYQLVGLDTSWFLNSTGQIQFVGLAPGSYQLNARYKRENGQWSKIYSITDINVFPAYYQTTWFLITVTLIVLLSIVLYYQYRINKRKQESDLNLQLKQFQYQALAAQMNPHFIFNSLNSINNFILKNKREESSMYLSSFARLMRSILDNSRENVVPLKDIILNLERYLELEKLRLKGKLDYAISAPSQLNQTTITLPNMLIQPFVENAIWHGIAPRKEPGFVEIQINRSDRHLIILVTDNGIGRKEAAKLKSTLKKRSAGTYLTHRRFELMSSLYGEAIHHEIRDLYDTDGNATGTQVTIQLPLKS